MLNRVVLTGRMGRDPELRRTQTGTAVTSFTLAVDRDFKDKQTGERATDWIDIVAWRQTADFIGKYGRKGRLVCVDGKLQTRDWVDKNGGTRKTIEVVADQIYFLDRKEIEPMTGYTPHAGGYGAPPKGEDGFEDLPDDDGEIPF